MPVAGGKGDQLRGFQFARALAGENVVEVVTTAAGMQVAGAEEEIRTFAELRVIRPSTPERALGAVGALVRGQPAQVGWMTPWRAWRTVRRRAEEADVILAMSVRSLRAPLPVPVVLDHVDAFSLNMTRRATGPEPAPVRWAARIEAALLRRWERRLSGWVSSQLVTSPVDARHLPRRPEMHVLMNTVDLPSANRTASAERDIDVILTGNMAYPPNADAAGWLSEAIAPALWRRRPNTSVWVVGRDAGRLSLDKRVQIDADVPDLTAYLRRAKVALAPLRLGTGTPNKVLEAIAAGAPVVATPAAVESFDFPTDAVAQATTAEEIADEVVRLLDDTDARERRVVRAGALLSRFDAGLQQEQLAAIFAAAVGP